MAERTPQEMPTGERPDLVPLTLLVNGDMYTTEAGPMAIFHEVLEQTVPAQQLKGHRIRISTQSGEEIFPDMFIGETAAHFQTHTFHVEATPLREMAEGAANVPWTNLGFDHIAITVADRADAKIFLSEALGMTVVRDDRHQTVLTTGNTAIFCFGTEIAPLSDGLPSRWHHLGFVVDNLEAAYQHLARYAEKRRAERGENTSGTLSSDFMLLERNERWSLYCHYRNGETSLMIQLSEIKPEARGFANPQRFTDQMYDYLSGRYGVRFEEESTSQPEQQS
ncbi:MAG TPA: VOC family protein [Ktedonobacterales bacterium]|nr:VOC family protein [Ktedonobacterales bacterium]